MKRTLLFATMLLFASVAFSQNIYFSEDFEAGAPNGWTVEDQWAYGNNGSLSSAYLAYDGNDSSFAAFNDDAAGNAHTGGGRIISPSIDLTAVTGPLLLEANIFFSNADYQGADETLMLMVSKDGGTSWEMIEDYGAESWTRKVYDFEAYSGETIMIAFEYQDGNQWNFGAAIDDIGLSDDLVFTPRKEYLLTVNGGTEFTQAQANVDYTVSGIVLNTGYDDISSFDINVTSEGVTTTFPFTQDIPSGGVYRYDLPETITTGDGFVTYEVAIANVNGDPEEDPNTADNSAMISFAAQSSLNPEQAVVVEEATGAWCPWCTRGTTYLDEMSKRFPDNFIGIAVHNSDILTLGEYDTAITSFPGFTGFPSVIYNRASILDPSEIVAPSISDASQSPIATLELGGEENGGMLSTSVKVTFNQAVTANHNVSVILTEDGLSDPSDEWNQANAYAGGGAGPMGGFEYLPSDVSSELFPYDHVGRALIGGYAGLNDVVGDFEAGSKPSVFMPDFAVPAEWNKDNMHVVAILTDAAGQVVNAISGKYNDVIASGNVTSTEEVLNQNFASVYPNPADQMTTISMLLETPSEVNVTVLDNLGRLISSKQFGELNGFNKLNFDVSNINPGIYMMNIQVNNKIVTKKITIQ